MVNYYPLTFDQRTALYQAQHGACGKCGRTDRYLEADHHHPTGIVRGLLCGTCNRAIGMLGDDVAGVQQALDYLLRTEEDITFPPERPRRRSPGRASQPPQGVRCTFMIERKANPWLEAQCRSFATNGSRCSRHIDT